MTRHTMIVTGGAGFIGANFVRLALKKPDAHVIVIDKLTYAGHRENLDGLWEHPRLEFIHGDIADAQTMGRVLESYQPRWVINFAAESHVDRSIDDPFPFIRTNVTGTLVLLEAARQVIQRYRTAERSHFRFLHVSTDEVYGTLGASGAFREETPYAPNSPYAASKAGADHFVRAYFHTYGLPILMTNCSNNYGPYQFPEKLIPLIVLNALDGKPLPIYGRGTNVRDWLFVEDHCEGLFLVLENGQPGEKYNLGGQSERTNVAVVDHICDILDEIVPCRDNPMVAPSGISKYAELKTFVKDRPGHDFRYAIDPSKIQRELGWHPRHSFSTGIRQTVEWYVTNRRWCDLVTQNVYHRERLGLETSKQGS